MSLFISPVSVTESDTLTTVTNRGNTTTNNIGVDYIVTTNNGNGTNVKVGDDAWIGDINISNTISIRGLQDATKGYIVFGNSNTTAYIGRDGTNPITVYGGQLTISGSATGNSAIMLQLNGYTNKGGTGYHDFLSATNTYASATNPNKFFRLGSTGTLEIINSAYTTNIFSLTDTGALTVPGTISASNFSGTSSGTNTGDQVVGAGALSLSISQGATNTSVTVSTGTGFNANTTSATAYTMTVGPALVNLATLMTTAGAGFIKRGAIADTYTIDTNTYLTSNQNISVTGDATGSGTTSIALTLANSGVTAGTYTKVTVDSKGRVTTGASLASADLPTYTGTLTASQVNTALGYTAADAADLVGLAAALATINGV